MGGLYNVLAGWDPACVWLAPMLTEENPQDFFPRFRDCWLSDSGDAIEIFTRVGGGNREYYECEIEALRDMPTDYHMDALEFLRTRGDEEADLVLYDPPYSITQASTLYKSYGKKRLEVNVANMRYWKLVKDEIARVTKPGGVVLSCGWSTNGMGKVRGFTLRRIRIVAHGGSKNDTLVTIEEKAGA